MLGKLYIHNWAVEMEEKKHSIWLGTPFGIGTLILCVAALSLGSINAGLPRGALLFLPLRRHIHSQSVSTTNHTIYCT